MIQKKKIKIKNLQGQKSHIAFDLVIDFGTINDFRCFGNLLVISKFETFEIRIQLVQQSNNFFGFQYFCVSKNERYLSAIIRTIDIHLATFGFRMIDETDRIIDQILELIIKVKYDI